MTKPITETTDIHDNRIGITSHDSGRTTRFYYVTGTLTNWHQTSGITHVEELAGGTDEATRQLVETLLAILGVAEIMWLNPNRLILVINPMFTWDQVQSQVIAALRTRLGWEEGNTSVMSYDDFQQVAAMRDAGSLPPSRLA